MEWGKDAPVTQGLDSFNVDSSTNSRVLFMFVNVAFGPLSLPVPKFPALKKTDYGGL